MLRFKAPVRWMSEDLGGKTHILHSGGLTEKLPCQNMASET